jgi:hypothetical protein
VAAGVFVKANLDVEEFDTNNNFSGGRFTPTVAGYYQISGVIHHNCTGTTTAITTQLRKNGLSVGGVTGPVGTTDSLPCISTLVYLNGTTDYMELWGYQIGGSNNLFANGLTWMSGALVRAAS